mmetsp:Transcript_19579/g.45905  ORF Transcript_19579/g.45905 Transcript_19579/m.45905 type:complete len:325 (-) Transcript_19579:88-1062(-)
MLADVLIPLLKGTVIPTAVRSWRENMVSFINNDLNSKLSSDIRMHIPYFANVTLDYAQVGLSPHVSSDELSVTLNGTFFDADHVKVSELSPAAFIVRDPKEKQSKEVQVFLTDYVLNTALASAQTSLQSVDVADLLKTWLNFNVSTDVLDPYLPGLLAKYGPGKAVNLSGRLTQGGGTVSFAPTVQRIDGTFYITGTVDSEVFVQAELVGTSFAFSFHSDDTKVFGNITKSSLGSLQRSTFYTTLDWSGEALLSHLQGMLDRAMSDAKSTWAHGLVVPTFMGVNVSNFEVRFHDGYVCLGFSFSEGMQDAVRVLSYFGSSPWSS